MKTKEELAKEYASDALGPSEYNGLYVGFIAGYESCEKAHDWIPINEDYSNLPEPGTNCVIKTDGLAPIAAIWTGKAFVCVWGKNTPPFMPTSYKII